MNDIVEIVKLILKRINRNTKINSDQSKRDYHFMGCYMKHHGKLPVKWHKKSQVAARRAYQYYSVGYGDWEGPSPRKMTKMGREKFEELLRRREELKRGILLENNDNTTPQSHETEGIILDEESSHVPSCETEGINNVEELSHMTFTAPREGTEDPFRESGEHSFYGVLADLPTRRPVDSPTHRPADPPTGWEPIE